MPGIDLNLDLPSLSDPLATIVAKTAIALAAIEDDLAGPVTVGELDMNGALSMEGNPIIDVGGLTLGAGAVATPGTLVYLAGELYVYTAAGPVQITAGGALNAASIGGITGMGGTNAAVAFDLASGEFRFWRDTGVKADIVADDVVLTGAAGTVRLGVDAAITSARVINVKSLPTAGVGLLAYDAATSSLVDASAVTVTKDHTFSGTITVGTNLKHTFERTRVIKLSNASPVSGVLSISPGAIISSGAAQRVDIELDAEVGDRIKAVTVRHDKNSAANSVFNLWRLNNVGSIIETTTVNVAVSGAGQTTTITVAAPTALSAGERYVLSLNYPATGDRTNGATNTVDRP